MRLAVRAPGGKLVRVLPGKILDGERGTAVGVALAQHRVHGASKHLGIAFPDLLLQRRDGVLRIIRQFVSLRLQLRYGGLQLRHGSADVRKLYDVCLGILRELAEPGEVVGDALSVREILGKIGQYPAGQRDVAGLDLDSGALGEGADDGQQGIGGQRGGFVCFSPNNSI